MKNTKKYPPFFTRLKRAWEAYNEEMPIKQSDESWYKEARERANKKRFKTLSEKPLKEIEKNFTPGTVNKWNTLIKKSDPRHSSQNKQNPYISVGQIYEGIFDPSSRFRVEKISKGIVAIRYTNTGKMGEIELKSLKQDINIDHLILVFP